MKKLSLLIALCMLISIGGVYATWIYVKDADVADETKNKAVSMAGVDFSGSNGSFTVDVSGVTLEVDQADANHKAELVITGNVVFKFTPSLNAPANIKESGLDGCKYSVTLSNSSWQYESENIFTINDYNEMVTWTNTDVDGVFTFELGAEALANIISLGDFTLDTKADYDAFDTALENGLIVFGISDGVTSTTTTE